MNKLYKDHLKEAGELGVNPPHDDKGMLLPLLKHGDPSSDTNQPGSESGLNKQGVVQNTGVLTTSANNEGEKPKKSPISLKDNSHVLIIIDQIFALIIRLYGEIKVDEDDLLKKKKEGLIATLLGLVKILSKHPDNHKTIFEIVFYK